MSVMAILAVMVGLMACAPLCARGLGRLAGWPLGLGLLGVALAVVVRYPASGAEEASLAWMPTVDIALRLRLDGLSFLFALVVLVIGGVVLIYSTAYLKDRRPVGFYTLMTAFAAAMLLLVLAGDLVVLFVAWELTTLCSFLLIARSGPRAGPPATRTLLVTVAGGLCLLGAVALIAIRTGTTDLTAALAHPAWAQDPAFTSTAAVLVAVAAMTKSAQFPFHSWLPDAMVAPAPVSAYLHAAAMVKAGIFLLMRFADAASHAPVWPVLLVSVGLVTTVMGASFALQRSDLKELLAYSTVSQLGLLVAAIGIGTPGAMLAASVHVVAHALFKSAAFMHVGLLEKRVGTRDATRLRGLARAMPWDAAMLALAAASMAGLPPALGFVSKELFFEAMLGAPAGAALGWLVALAAAGGAALTFAYSARMVVTTFPGPATELSPQPRYRPMSLAISLAAFAGTAAGVAVWTLDDLVAPAAAIGSGTTPAEVASLHLWHGVNAPLALSAAAITTGALLTVWRDRVDSLLARPLFPGNGVDVVQWIQDATIATGRRVGDMTRTSTPTAHLVIPVGLIGLCTLGIARLWRGFPATMAFDPVDAGLLLGMSIGIGTLLRTRTRLTAVIASGVVGFSVALWFFVLGASDVALTQLLVEILTVVIMVLVLRRMGRSFVTTSRRRTVFAAGAALGAGTAATLAALAFTGHRSLSPTGEFFLREAEQLTGGTNVVNTILVDFRALDTLGELVVLAVGALAVTALLDARRPVDGPVMPIPHTPLADPGRNAVFLAVLDRVVMPLMLIGSIYALVRGHNAPGGGFIAALIGVSAPALAYLAASSDDTPRLTRPYLAIAGTGIAIAVGSGLLGLIDGSFLRPLHMDLLGVHLTTALIFDVGVYLAVFGVILAALNLLGTPQANRLGEQAARPTTERAMS